MPEDGRFDSAPVAVDDPDLTAKVNADWWRMAVEYGLRLAGEWDVVDSRVPVLRSGFAGLFTESFVPEFTMLSLDGWVLLTTTVWGDGTVSTIVIRADRLPGEPRRAPVDRFWIFCSSR